MQFETTKGRQIGNGVATLPEQSPRGLLPIPIEWL